jgi:hypothetical protein
VPDWIIKGEVTWKELNICAIAVKQMPAEDVAKLT